MTDPASRTQAALLLQIQGIERMQTALMAVDPGASESGGLHARWQRLESDRQRLAVLLADATEPARVHTC